MALWTMACVLLAAAMGVTAVGPQAPRRRPSGLPTYHAATHGALNGSDFASWVTRQAGEGHDAVALAAGQYHVTGADAEHGAYFYLANLRNVAIWMDGVNMTLADNTVTAFSIDTCANVSTYGPAQLWWAVPGFGQATITAVTAAASGSGAFEVQFELDRGYNSSTLITDGVLNGEYTSPTTGRLQAGPGWSTFSGPVTAVAGHADTYSFTYSDGYFAPRVGFKLLSRGQFLFCNVVANSNGTAINDLTMLNCGGFGYFSTANRHTTFSSFALRRAPFAPPGGTRLPARSSSADGVHSASDYVGPTLESCFFDALDDDCIAIHGALANTTRVDVSQRTIGGTVSAHVGDVLRFYSPGAFVPLGAATVLRSSTADPTAGAADLTLDWLPPSAAAGRTTYVNTNRVGSGFAIRNTHTAGNRGRGAIIKASHGVVANNLFEGVAYAALYLGPEFAAWGEADYVRNVTLANNTIRACSYLDKAAAAFDLHGDSDAEGSADPADNPATGNAHVTVDGLTIVDSGSHSNLYVGAASHVRLSRVSIVNALHDNYTLWENCPDAIVNFQNVHFDGPVDICLQHAANVSGVRPLQVYGSALGAPTSLPHC